MANKLAYGFTSMAHLMGERVTKIGERVVFDAVRESAAEHTRQISAILAGAGLVERMLDHKIRFYLPGEGTLQPLDEHGNPRPVRPAGSYDVALPIQGGGTAWGDNRITRALMTVEEANRFTVDAQRRDADWVKRHVLAAVFDNATWTYPDEKVGDLTIQPLANADTVKYVKTGGASETDDHYLAQAAAISDAANPFPTIHKELNEHPSNVGEVVVYVPTNLVDDVEALSDFVEVRDPSIDPGANKDRLVASIDRGFGDKLIGYVSRCWIVEWKALPDDYMIAHVRGQVVLGMREYPAAELQGFFPEFHSADGNTRITRMLRFAGFGVMNRVAACVMRIGNAAYAVPASYDAPLAI